MRLVKRVGSISLLVLGIPVLLAALYAPINPDLNPKDRISQFWVGLMFGVPVTAWGTWLAWELHQQKRQDQRDRLQAVFLKLLRDSNGSITLLQFAAAAQLPGEAAKHYLDEQARVFAANFEVDDAGGIFYRFNIAGLAELELDSVRFFNSSSASRRHLPVETISFSTDNLIHQNKLPVVESTFDVILETVPRNQVISVIKVVRKLTHVGLKEAKDLVEAAPVPIKEQVSHEIAQECKRQLEAVGARVMIIAH